MQLSRWGRSAYETPEDIGMEQAALSELVQVTAPGMDAEIVVVHSKVGFGQDELLRAPSVRLVLTTTSGTDHIDLQAMKRANVQVARTPLARRDAVVETTIGMLLWGLHCWGPLNHAGRQGQWARARLPELAPRLLGQARVGIVGLGVIGQEVARRLAMLGVEVLGVDPRGIPDSVQAATAAEMLRECDALTLHCDLNATTEGLIGRHVLESASPELVLVNTARGGIVDTAAALTALSESRLGALCLDVFEEEPYPNMQASSVHDRLWVHPHSAGYHRNLADHVRAGLVEAVSAFVQGGTPPFLVDASSVA